jgi:spoIIIJ-associated protein
MMTMEWVTITAATLDDAKNLALDQLGVAAEDAEFEILEEPKQGLFGRMRGEARVRARVRPTSARAKAPRREARRERGPRNERGGDSRSSRSPRQRSGEQRSGERRQRDTDRESGRGTDRDSGRDEARAARRDDAPKVPVTTVSEAATTFLQGVMDAAGLRATVTASVEGEEIDISVAGDDLTVFVGPKGATLTALQDLTRVVSQRRLGDHDTRLRIDVGGYRERRREALGRFAMKVAQDVMESGTPRILEPMNSADRKIVHDTLATVADVVTHSEGDDPFRRVVVSLAPHGQRGDDTGSGSTGSDNSGSDNTD